MIFQTITNDLDGVINRIGICNRSFADLKNAFSSNGVSGVFNSLAFTVTEKDISNIKEYNRLVGEEGISLQTAWYKTMMSSSKAAQSLFDDEKNLIQTENGAILSTETLTAAQNTMTLSAKAATVATKALAVVGNMLAMWAITKVVTIAAEKIDDLAHSAENCAERVDELMSSYESALNTANSNADRVEELADKYETFSKGVNNLGQNVSLTADEYTEYNDIVNEIADMFPTLIQGYTSEGNAILSLKGNVEELRDAYKEAQQEAYNMLIISGEDSDGNDIIKNWENLHSTDFFSKLFDFGAADVGGDISVQEAIDQLKALSEMSAETYRNIERITGSGTREQIASLTDIEKDIGYGSYIYKALGINENVTDKEFEEAKTQAKALIQTYQAEIDSALKNVQTLANAYLMTSEDYADLDDNAKTAASLIVNSIGTEVANGFKDKVDVGAYVANIVSMIKDNPDIQYALNGLFTTDFSPLSYDDAKAVIDQYIDTIAKLTGRDPIELKTTLGFSDYDNNENLVNNVKEKLQDEFDDKVGELTLEDLQIAAEQIEVSDGVLLTWDELIEKIEEYKDSLVDSTPSISDTFALKDAEANATVLSNLSDQLSEVESAYQACLAAKEEYDEQGYLSVDTLQKVLSLGDEYLQYLFDEEGNIRLDAEAFQQLTLARINDMETQALNNLAENIRQITDEASATEYLTQEQKKLADAYTDTAFSALYALGARSKNSETMKEVYNSFKIQYEQIKSLFTNTRKSVSETYSGISETSKETTQTIEDYIDSYMDYMEKSLEGSRIDYQTYTKEVSAFLASMYNDGKLAAKEYYDYTGQMLEVQKSIYETALSAVTNLFDNEINKYEDLIDGIEKQNDALEEQKTLMENAADAVVDYYEALIDGENDAIDALNEANDGIQERLDKYDSLINVADRLYESEQENLKAQQEVIQEKIDLLNDENDALDFQYRKEQALYELQRSQSQRTKLIYTTENGFVYQTDNEAISDAKKNVEDIKTEELISSLEKEQDALRESIDALQKYRDALGEISQSYQKLADERSAIELIGEDYENIILGTNINDWLILKDKYISANRAMADNEALIKSHEEKISAWEAEKESWSSLSGVIDEETKKQAAIRQFGADWEQQINEDRLVSFDIFKTSYLDIQSRINDNTSLMESYEEKIEYYQNLKAQWSDIADVYEQSMEDQYAAMLWGQNWEALILSGRLDTLEAFKKDYLSIQQAIADAAWKSANEQIRAAQEAQKGTGGSTGSAGNVGGDDYIPTESSASWAVLNYYSKGVIKAGFSSATEAAQWAQNNGYAFVRADNTRHAIMVKAKPKVAPATGGGFGGGGFAFAETHIYGSGTDNARKGINLVGERGTETYIGNSGRVSLITGPAYIPMLGGETVKNAAETKTLLNTVEWLSSERNAALLANLDPEDMWQRWQSIIPDPLSMFFPDITMPGYDLTQIQNNTTPVVQNINLTLPNVTNTSGVEYLERELGKLPLQAVQHAVRR